MRVTIDETLRSQLNYGGPEFPFSCYVDSAEQYWNERMEWHWHNEFEFSYVLQGTVLSHVGNEVIRLERGDGLFVNSGTIHRFEPGDKDLLMVNFIFSPEFIVPQKSVIYLQYVQPVLTAELEYQALKNSVSSPLVMLYEVVRSDGFGKELRIRNLLSELWLTFVEQLWPQLQGGRSSSERTTQARLQKMMTYIHSHYGENLSLEMVATAANVSKSEALRCFHEGIETTPMKYLNEYRLVRAEEQLRKTVDPVTKIAADCGFDSLGYFCQVFKKKYGVSPKKYRILSIGDDD